MHLCPLEWVFGWVGVFLLRGEREYADPTPYYVPPVDAELRGSAVPTFIRVAHHALAVASHGSVLCPWMQVSRL